MVVGKRPNDSVFGGRKRGRMAGGGGGGGGRGRGRGGGRGRGNNDEDSDGEDIALINQRRAQAMEEEEEDIQGEYREEGGILVEDIYIPPKHTRTEHPQVGERLVIEKIVCENFKSYGGIKEMGPFHKSFSAIVGPNGNGKSNIIDAMLFVFGYRASKIRCKKVSVLIHKSELLPNVRSCAVTVHFVKINDTGNDESDYEVIPNSTITVTRRAFSDNSSGYRLDGKRVKFQEVATFLKANGIDIVHNRFLILQGEVEQIAQMPPRSKDGHETGLVEFLEEVIGSHRYITPLAKLTERVNMLEIARDEKISRVALVEAEKTQMTGPVEKAKDFLRDQNTKTRLQHTVIQLKTLEAKTAAHELEMDKAGKEEEKQGVMNRLKEIYDLKKEREGEYAEAEKKFKQAEAEFNKNKRALERAEEEHINIVQELKRSNESRKKNKKAATKFEEEIENLKGLPENHERDIARLEKRKVELENNIAKEENRVAGDLEALNVKVEEALKKKEVAEKECGKWKKVRDEKKGLLTRLTKELSLYKEKEEAEATKLAELEEDVENLKNNISKREKESRTSLGKDKIPALEAEVAQKKEQVEQLRAVEHDKGVVAEKFRSEYEQAKESLECGNVTDKVYKAFFTAKDEGKLPGLYGRVKDLATIDEKYNVAATVATGVLEYWVTDTADTATECIQFLKAKGLPSQTFMCLEKMKRFEGMSRQPFRTPNRAHRIFDLLKLSKPELASIYYKAYFNTLVCDNIDIGTEIAFGRERYRVATCKGEIIDPSGSLMGGGAAITQGKFNSAMSKMLTSKITRETVANLKRKLDAAAAELEQAQSRRQQVENTVHTISAEIATLRSKMNNFASDLAALKGQLPLKQERLSEQRKIAKEAKIVPAVLKEKETAVKKVEKEFENAEKPYLEAQENVDELSEEVKLLQRDKKNEIREKLDEFLSTKKSVVAEINKKTIELKNCEKNRAKAEEKLKAALEEVSKLEAEMKSMNEKKKKLEEKGIELKEKEEGLEAKMKETKAEYEEMKTSANEFEKEEKTLFKKKVGFENELQRINADLKAWLSQLSQLEGSMEGLVVKEIPEEIVEPLTMFSDEELRGMRLKDVEHDLNRYIQKLKREEPNLNILVEYQRKVDLYLERVQELDEVTKRVDKFRSAFLSTTAQRLSEFMEGFAIISSKLKEIFRMISMGGDAELDLVNSTDPFTNGVEFCVRPARKTWKKISNLSGGEKTLSSLALVFALHYFKPSPFYVMDEIDAALDFKNVSIIANYIKDRTKFTQFIIISLRSNMFELADSLLGVYKVDNMSYSIHIGVTKLLGLLQSRLREVDGAAALMHHGNAPSTADEVRVVASRQDKATNPNALSQPPALNVSAITDAGEVDSQKSKQSVSNEKSKSTTRNSPLSDDEENTLVPNDADGTESSNLSQDLFGDQEMASTSEAAGSQFGTQRSEISPIQKPEGAEGNGRYKKGPIAASTPFVGRVGTRKRAASRDLNLIEESDSGEENSV